jgi:hypothetical protein
MRNRTWVATLLDGSQIMVEYWADDDSVTVATRTDGCNTFLEGIYNDLREKDDAS